MGEEEKTIGDLTPGVQRETPRSPEEAAEMPPTPQATAGSGFTRIIRAETFDGLRAYADPARAKISSHRGLVGPLIVAAKRLIAQLLSPVAAFHRASLEALEQIENALRGDVLGRLDGYERRLMALEKAVQPGTPGDAPKPFDYPAFEEAFRGSREEVLANQEHYLEYFPDASCGPVLDLGCGRGEFLSLLAGRGIEACGVDLEKRFVEAGRAVGLDVRQEDAALALQRWDDQSLGGVVAFQVFEHLTLETITRILELARRKLRPGGVLILETVNVASLITHARAFTLDPTHELALHPFALRLLVEGRGFQQVEIVYSGDVEEDVRLDTSGLEPQLAENLEKLNRVVFGPQDYAIVARA